jgi:hypothetical protein
MPELVRRGYGSAPQVTKLMPIVKIMPPECDETDARGRDP